MTIESTPVNIWLRASALLRRMVPLDEPYPHVCQVAMRRDCAACSTSTAGSEPGDGYLHLSVDERAARMGVRPESLRPSGHTY